MLFVFSAQNPYHSRPCIGCRAKVAELVDALDLGSSGATCESSSLSFRTNLFYIARMCFTHGLYVE